MKKSVLILWMALSGPACSYSDDAAFQKLSATTCTAYSGSAFKPALTAEWRPYLSVTRVCLLIKKPGDKAAVALVSVFIGDYYRGKPENALWENFPKPILFDGAGQRVGELSELFPEESPGEMILTYGRWQGDIPGEIRMHIINPAVTGDYDLPTLLWNKEQHRYLPKTPPAKGEKRQ